MRRASRTSLTRFGRGVVVLCLLAVVAVTILGTVDGEKARRTAQTVSLRVRNYAAVRDLAKLERDRLVSQGPAAARTPSFSAAELKISRSLSSLLMHSSGHAASEITRFQVSYVAAKRDAAAGRTDRLENVLASMQVGAANELHNQQASWLVSSGTSPLRKAELGSSALLGLVSLLWLLRRGLLKLRRPQETSDVQFEELRTQARTDSLTQLGNHRAFHYDLSTQIARRGATGSHFTLMAVDLDGLKQINDTKGHPAGDAHIKAITQCLRTIVGRDGTIYRTGGDEFMVILPDKRNWDALLLANRIEHVTRQMTGARAVSIGLTESMGLEGRQLLVHQADLALYEAKRTKLSAVTYHPGLATSPHDGSETLGPSTDQRALAAALARAVDAKDGGTRSHSETVAELSVAMARRLGFTGHRLERLRLAGLLHDVGKIGVADAILQKAAALAEDERLAMTDHVKTGHAILVAAELPTEADWILHHHERFDGTGYPAGRSGDEIPLESRIITAADAFEAMTGLRPYRESVSTEEALAELRLKAGSQFDPDCVEALAAAVANDSAILSPERLNPADVPAPPARKQPVPKRARPAAGRQAGNLRRAM
jgi:diguanylate cyclase (GGDEF)-like protein/putative nucleotidyltransferase with HDIG domain